MNKTGNGEFYKKVEIIQNIVAEILNFLPAFAASVIVQAGTAKDRMGAEGFWLPVLALLFYYFLREVSERLPVFLLLHVLPVAGIIFFYENSLFPKVIMAGMVSIFMLLSISKRVKGQKRGMEAAHPAAAVGVFFALSILDSTLGRDKTRLSCWN